MKRYLPIQVFQRLPVQGCCLALFIVLLTCWIRRSAGFSEKLELPLYDLTTRLTWPWKAGHPDIVLVSIQDGSLGSILNDETLADALETIVKAEPSIVGIDLIRDKHVPDGNQNAATRLKSIGTDDRLVWIEVEPGVDDKGKTVAAAPPPFITGLADEHEKSRKSASATFPADGSQHQTVRRGRIALWIGDSIRFSLASQLAKQHAEKGSPGNADKLLDRLVNEIGSMPCSAGGYWLTDSNGKCANGCEFLLKPVPPAADIFGERSLNDPASRRIDGRSVQIPVYSLTEILEHKKSPDLIRQALNGKIVIFGTTDWNTSGKDDIPVVGDPSLRGLKLHALATAQLLRELGGEDPIRFLSDRSEDGFVLLASLIALVILGLPSISPMAKGIGVVIILPLAILAAALVLLKSGIWVPSGAPIFAGTTTGLGGLMLLWRKSSKERTMYLKVMTAHLGPEVTARVLARNDLLTAGMEKPPETFEATAFFGDLRSYSSASQYFQENHPTAEFFSWLNGILRPAVEITGRHGGFVKQFAGDGIFVIFGFPPETGGAHAQRAVDCARELAALVPTLNRDLPAEFPPYHLRIGIYTGNIHASSVGGGRHTDYSFLGPTTNKAARLESLDKDRFDHARHPVRILISDNTRRQLDNPSSATPYRDGPVQIDKTLPHEQVWEILSPTESDPSF